MPSPIRDNVALSRYELDTGGGMAVLNYKIANGVITMMHTETPPELRGRGIASQLVKSALDAARAHGLKVVPRCPFVSAYIARHPEFRDLVA
jgi:hypothetical protein